MDTQKIFLESPIKRGETEITAIEIRKPNAGALRGVSLRAILDYETDAIMKVLPRVSDPALTPAEVATMDPVDILQSGNVVAAFLLPKRLLEEATAQAKEASPFPVQ